MAEEYVLTTPEAVTIEYDVAGIGTRFLAAIIDSLVWLVLEGVVVLGAIGLVSVGGMGRTVGVILGLSLSFILLWGYFIIFETVWSGQTPGKRFIKIRVIKTSGYPIGFVDAVIRNLVRIVDFLPPPTYFLGVITMFISPQARRLGDYAAGTIVVKERAPVRLADLSAGVRRSRNPGYPVPARGQIDPEELQWDLRAMTPRDIGVVNDFLDRAPGLEDEVRRRIGDEIAVRLASRIGAREPLDPIRFLERVLLLQEQDA